MFKFKGFNFKTFDFLRLRFATAKRLKMYLKNDQTNTKMPRTRTFLCHKLCFKTIVFCSVQTKFEKSWFAEKRVQNLCFYKFVTLKYVIYQKFQKYGWKLLVEGRNTGQTRKNTGSGQPMYGTFFSKNDNTFFSISRESGNTSWNVLWHVCR